MEYIKPQIIIINAAEIFTLSESNEPGDFTEGVFDWN